ncbi:MAG: 16S rRNA (cytosine(1402)-N(4))-methyltransferase RsmH [Magnetococcus sp. DMHC-6]
MAVGSVPSSELIEISLEPSKASLHQSVLLHDAVAGLFPVSKIPPQPPSEGIYVDATFGDGGHTFAILKATTPHGRVIALDRDIEAINNGHQLASRMGIDPDRLTLIHAPFSQLNFILKKQNITKVNAVLFDLGVSSRQLDTPHRGFSFHRDGPLDMRMDQTVDHSGRLTTTAEHLLNHLTAEELAQIFYEFGEERFSRRIARVIIDSRRTTPLTTTKQLADLVRSCLPSQKTGIHPATRVFQALRIAVNQELAELKTGLDAAMNAIETKGRVVVISFHSLEDRIVKTAFQLAALPKQDNSGTMRAGRWIPTPQPLPLFQLITKKPIMPSQDEIRCNSRSRSAKMRIIERIAPTGDQIGSTNPLEPKRYHECIEHPPHDTLIRSPRT